MENNTLPAANPSETGKSLGDSSSHQTTRGFITDDLSLTVSPVSSGESWATISLFDRASAFASSRDDSISFEPKSTTTCDLIPSPNICVVNAITLYDAKSMPSIASQDCLHKEVLSSVKCLSSCTVESCPCSPKIHSKMAHVSYPYSPPSVVSSSDVYPSTSDSSPRGSVSTMESQATYIQTSGPNITSSILHSKRNLTLSSIRRNSNYTAHWLSVKRKIMRMLNVPRLINLNIRKNIFQQEVY